MWQSMSFKIQCFWTKNNKINEYSTMISSSGGSSSSRNNNDDDYDNNNNPDLK